MDRDAEAAGEDGTEGVKFPHWVAQPYVRPLPASEGGSRCVE